MITKSGLTVFQFRKTIYYLSKIIGSITIFIAFILFAIVMFHLLKLKNEIVTVVLFLVLILGLGYILRYFFSKITYKDIYKIHCVEKKLVLTKGDNVIEEFDFHEINHIKFLYQGDLLWNVYDSLFPKIKYKCRYIIKNASAESVLNTFDYIAINSKKYLVKIRNIEDKKYFYKVATCVKESGIKCDFIELDSNTIRETI